MVLIYSTNQKKLLNLNDGDDLKYIYAGTDSFYKLKKNDGTVEYYALKTLFK